MKKTFTLEIPVPKSDEDLDNMALQLTIAAAALMPSVENNEQAESTALVLFNNLRQKLLDFRANSQC